MLAFNQKVGTLVLETASGTAALYLSRGRVSFFASDPVVSEWMGRLAKRTCRQPRRLDQAIRDQKESRRYMGNILLQMRLFTEQEVRDLYTDVAADRIFHIQSQEIHSFEFREGISVGPDGSASTPLDPLMQVDALLLDLTRKMDHWASYREQITSLDEVYEQSGEAWEPTSLGDVDPGRAHAVAHAVDGVRTVRQIAEASGVDLFTTVQALIALLDQGAIRVASTAGLYDRAQRVMEEGDARTGASLLGALAGRQDAPMDAALLEAEAYESLGEDRLAATAMERYANAEHQDPEHRYRALYKAASLRENDLASWLTVCDAYLQRRDVLYAVRESAAEAVHIAARLSLEESRPHDAATRLQAFVDLGDVRSEDRVLLADLYAASDDISAAAKTLCAHGDDILAAGRPGAALAVYRRALRLDPQCKYARKRVGTLEPSMTVPRRSTLRRTLPTLLIPVLLAAAGIAGWNAMKQTDETVDLVADRSKTLVARADDRGAALITSFQKHVDAAAVKEDGYDALVKEATHLRERVAEAMATDDGEIEAMAKSLDNARRGGTSVAEQIREALRECQARADARVTKVLGALKIRCEHALHKGKKAHAEGNFTDAHGLLLEAQSLSVHNEDVHLQAEAQFAAVSRYLKKFEDVRNAMEHAEVAGDLQQAYATGIEGIRELLDSDVTRSLRFPVQVTSTPPDAEIYVGGVDTGLRTPTVIHYSPMSEDTFLKVRLPGYTTFEVELPTLSHATRPESTAHEWKNVVDCTLAPGPSAVVHSRVSPTLTHVWSSGEQSFVLGSEGHVIFAVDTQRSRLVQHTSTPAHASAFVNAGAMSDGYQWTFSDDETLEVHRGDGLTWRRRLSTPMVGAPVLRREIVLVLTASGAVLGLDAKTGGLAWQHALPSRPRHGLRRTTAGATVTTVRGEVFQFHAGTGVCDSIAPARDERAGSVRLGRGVLVVGSGKGGLQFFRSAGRPTVLKHTRRVTGHQLVSSGKVAVWKSDAGVVALYKDTNVPKVVSGLPTHVAELLLVDDTLYAVEEGGQAVMAVSLKAPNAPLWRCPLPHVATGTLTASGPHLLVVTESGLAVIER